MAPASRCRARDLGIEVGRLQPGPHNAITDVAGVQVGHATLIEGDGALVVGKGPVRTGVTVVIPSGGAGDVEPVFAGWHVLNGNGEMTGLAWVGDSGLLTTPVAITNTHSVGVVRDALIGYAIRESPRRDAGALWALPVVGETWDGLLSDINGMHVRPAHVDSALEGASSGIVAEGTVGGGTGMVCHGFKGGIGTASRIVATSNGGWTVGVLVQANYGQRALLRVDGVPVGRYIDPGVVPLPTPPDRDTGSIIAVVATDAPCLPMQCSQLARRAGMGVARAGGTAANDSGDIFLAFATGNRGMHDGEPRTGSPPATIEMLPGEALTPLYEAVIDATEEAILNALCMATTITGINGVTAHAIPLDLLVEILAKHGRVSGVRA